MRTRLEVEIHLGPFLVCPRDRFFTRLKSVASPARAKRLQWKKAKLCQKFNHPTSIKSAKTLLQVLNSLENFRTDVILTKYSTDIFRRMCIRNKLCNITYLIKSAACLLNNCPLLLSPFRSP